MDLDKYDMDYKSSLDTYQDIDYKVKYTLLDIYINTDKEDIHLVPIQHLGIHLQPYLPAG